MATSAPATAFAQSTQERPADDVPVAVNPFANFETHVLSNGVRVWFKRLEGVPDASFNLVVPYGRDRDPPGKEQLAHFTEHMLFSDHDGRTEEEIKDAVESLGGARNGITYNDHTAYFVNIAKEHGLFALEWLAGIVEPHEMAPEVVERGRQPVAVEINARPRQFFETLFAALNPEWLMPPDFWEREFGMETRSLVADNWESLQSITPEDLRWFYETYYAPGAMTLTIVGDLDRDSTLALAERTFGTFPARPAAPRGYELEDPERGRSTYSWGFGSDITYSASFKVFDRTAEDEMHLLFVRDLLFRRLNQRLRYGERKAAYTPQVSTIRRGPALYLRIRSDINEDEYEYAREVIADELASLRAGSFDPEEFEEDRSALVERVRGANLTAADLGAWARGAFYDPEIFTDFPDLIAFYEGVSQEALAAYASRVMVPERTLASVGYLQPIGQGTVALVLILLVVLTHRGVSARLTTPIDMRRIRYVARLRAPGLLRLGRAVVIVGAGLAMGRLVVAGLIWLGSGWVVTIPGYLPQMLLFALMISGSLALAIVYASRFPKKLLIFPDHLRIKSGAYASRVLRREDIADLSRRSFAEVWLRPSILRCSALTFGLRGPGIFLEPKRGRAMFLRSRDTEELWQVLEAWKKEAAGEDGTRAAGGHGQLGEASA